MSGYTSDVAFTPAVKKVQERLGSRDMYARLERERPWATSVTEDLSRFIESLDMFYLGTSTPDGQPYIQYKGGPRGFLKVLDSRTLAWADFSGNRQYISTGNLGENDRAFIFLIDYQTQKRVKVWGRARVLEDDSATLERLRDPEYAGAPERAILFEIDTWDANCPQHIHVRLPRREVVPIVQELKDRITELENEVTRLSALPEKM